MSRRAKRRAGERTDGHVPLTLAPANVPMCDECHFVPEAGTTSGDPMRGRARRNTMAPPPERETAMKKPTLGQRFKYWFDGIMARGTGALLGVLGLATAVVILIDAAVIIFLTGSPGEDARPPSRSSGTTWSRHSARTPSPPTTGGSASR